MSARRVSAKRKGIAAARHEVFVAAKEYHEEIAWVGDRNGLPIIERKNHGLVAMLDALDAFEDAVRRNERQRMRTKA